MTEREATRIINSILYWSSEEIVYFYEKEYGEIQLNRVEGDSENNLIEKKYAYLIKKMLKTLKCAFPKVMDTIKVGRGKKYSFVCNYRLGIFSDIFLKNEDQKYEFIFEMVEKEIERSGIKRRLELEQIREFLYLCVMYREKETGADVIDRMEELLRDIHVGEFGKYGNYKIKERLMEGDREKRKEMLLYDYLERMSMGEYSNTKFLFTQLQKDRHAVLEYVYTTGVEILKKHIIWGKGIKILTDKERLYAQKTAWKYNLIKKYVSILNLKEEKHFDKITCELDYMRREVKSVLKDIPLEYKNMFISDIVSEIEGWYKDTCELVEEIKEYRYLEWNLKKDGETKEEIPIEELIEKLKSSTPDKRFSIMSYMNG